MHAPQRRDLLEQANDMLDIIPGPVRKTTEKRNPASQVDEKHSHRPPAFRYRLTDADLGGQIVSIAQSLSVSADEVARAFVEAALAAAETGDLNFSQVKPVGQRLTLYPAGNEKWSVRESPAWPPHIPARKKHRRLTQVEKAQLQKERNRYLVAYRWPEAVHKALCSLTLQLMGRVSVARSEGRLGHVLTVLLNYGYEAYRVGRLPLEPQPIMTRMSLK